MNAATHWHRTMESGEAHLRAAEQAPDNAAAIAAATDAVTQFRAALDLAPPASSPLDWATTQTRLTVALRLLGALLDESALLHDALRCGQAALSLAPLASAPQIWGLAQAAIASVYVVLGERDDDLAALTEAAGRYAEALEAFPRTASPRDWARMMRNRGAALSLAGEVGNDPDALTDAIGCYRAALETYTKATTPADWALTHSNLGHALRLLAERTDDAAHATALLAEAVSACEVALAATDRDAAPEEWGMTTTNLANALAALGTRARDADSLRRAIEAYRAALAALAGPRLLRQRAITRHNLALAEQSLATQAAAE